MGSSSNATDVATVRPKAGRPAATTPTTTAAANVKANTGRRRRLDPSPVNDVDARAVESSKVNAPSSQEGMEVYDDIVRWRIPLAYRQMGVCFAVFGCE
jgi:hypothetical protein